MALPFDPSENHNIAHSTQHEGYSVWFAHGRLYIEWKSTGSLLCIRRKRTLLLSPIECSSSDSPRLLIAGSRTSIIWFVVS